MTRRSKPSSRNTGFDDEEEGAPSVSDQRDEAGRDEDAADPIGEVSRFETDFESDVETDTFDDKWIEGGTLPDIPNRPGFMQRWINTEDKTNLSNQLRRGWRFRKAETLPKGFKAAPTVSHGEHAGLIGVAGQVLAEMPLELYRRHQKAQREATKKLEQAVENDLYRVKGPGMAPTQKEATTQTSVGRVPNIPEYGE